MLYTAGTTGRTKPFRRAAPTSEETKANFAHYAHVYGAQGFLERREAMVAMTPGPLYHAAPNAWSSFFLRCGASVVIDTRFDAERLRSEEHTSELQSLMRISYAVFCLKKKNNENQH